MQAAVASAFRDEWGRVVATVIRLTGDWDLAEECAQDAFARALERWGRDGGLHVGDYSSQIGLTSMLPFRAPGIFDATPMASSRSLQSTR